MVSCHQWAEPEVDHIVHERRGRRIEATTSQQHLCIEFIRMCKLECGIWVLMQCVHCQEGRAAVSLNESGRAAAELPPNARRHGDKISYDTYGTMLSTTIQLFFSAVSVSGRPPEPQLFFKTQLRADQLAPRILAKAFLEVSPRRVIVLPPVSSIAPMSCTVPSAMAVAVAAVSPATPPASATGMVWRCGWSLLSLARV